MRRNFVYLTASALLFLLTLPPFRQSWASAIGLVPLLLLMEARASFRRLVLYGLIAGLPFYAYGFYWILYYNAWIYFAVLLCHVPFVGLFLGLTGEIIRRIPKGPPACLIVPPLVWVCLSLLYEQTPLGTAGTQALFYQPLVWMQISRLLGVHGVVFLFVLLNAAIAWAWAPPVRKRLAPLVFTALLFLGTFLGGRRALAQTYKADFPVALIQHNLPLDKKWWMRNPKEVVERYRLMALEAAKQKPRLIIFPSYSMPFDAYREPYFFQNLARETGAYLLVSTYVSRIAKRRIAEVGQYEMALLFSPEGKLAGLDTAVQGPPFRDIDQVFAEKSEILETPLGRSGILLCFEDTLARMARSEVKRGAEVLIALSNPGHFTKTFLPEYHLFQDQLRAIETGLFVIRVSTHGYSAIIDPRGRVISRSELGRQEIIYGQDRRPVGP